MQLNPKKLNPMPGYFLVEPAKVEEKTSGGIYLPDSHDEKPQYGTILAVGDATVREGTMVEAPAKKGDKVVYKKWGGNDLKIKDVEYQFLQFEDVLAVIK